MKKRNLNTMSMIYFIVFFSLLVFGINTMNSNNTETIQRDYEYEHYCDSIWENDPGYYLDVLMETDEYQNYIDIHGQWWKAYENKE